MKIIKWVLAFLAFNILFALTSYISELYLGWVLKLSGLTFGLIILYLPITYFFMSSIILISSAISPNKFKAYSFIKWYSFACLLIGAIILFARKDNFSLLDFNNLICLAICFLKRNKENYTYN